MLDVFYPVREDFVAKLEKASWSRGTTEWGCRCPHKPAVGAA